MTKDPQKTQPTQNRTWQVAVGVVIAIILFVIWQQSASRVFKVTDGDQRTLVLIRSHRTATYTLEYTGNDSARIERIQLKLIAPGLDGVYTDVEEIRLVNGNESVVLTPEGFVLDGESFEVQPGDTIVLEIDLYGQSLGQNQLSAFIIQYYLGNNLRVLELKLENSVLDVE